MVPGKVITDDDYAAIVQHVSRGCGFSGLGSGVEGRLVSEAGHARSVLQTAVLALLGECGLRVGEVVGLRVSDVWGSTEVMSAVVVRADVAKYGRSRLVPLCGGAFQVLRVFGRLRCAGHDVEPDGQWFVGGGCARGVSVRTVQRWTASWGIEAIGRSVHPHAFRHFCINRLRRVCDIVTVAEIAGHRSIKTTQAYTHVGGQDMRAAMEAAGSVGGGA